MNRYFRIGRNSEPESQRSVTARNRHAESNKCRVYEFADCMSVDRSGLSQNGPAAAERNPVGQHRGVPHAKQLIASLERGDRKSTRLNSSHQIISYAVFCLKKKNT